MISRAAINLLRLIGAFVVVGGSFWATLSYLDYRDRENAATTVPPARVVVEVRPDRWLTALQASYELKNGTVVMHGPGHIYAEAECPAAKCDVDFSIEVQHADAANIGLRFVNAAGSPIGDAVLREISGMKSQRADVHANTRPGATKVQALVYAPKSTDAVVFGSPLIRIRPLV
jgi:hypothetical protein